MDISREFQLLGGDIDLCIELLQIIGSHPYDQTQTANQTYTINMLNAVLDRTFSVMGRVKGFAPRGANAHINKMEDTVLAIRRVSGAMLPQHQRTRSTDSGSYSNPSFENEAEADNGRSAKFPLQTMW
ncbi:hypothetical protein CspHIS471_0203570 [Cutaneotrichosporon sp. HIS471]|nr:hypothetical protein CspHIS471_0203570 [Cutaneotrichosporon sp. HIS471]